MLVYLFHLKYIDSDYHSVFLRLRFQGQDIELDYVLLYLFVVLLLPV